MTDDKQANWSDQIELTIRDIEKSCQAYKWMNIRSAKKNSRTYSIFMYGSILLTTICGIISATSTKYSLQLVVTILSFSSGTISAIIKFSQWEQKSITHKAIAAKYASLENNIRRQLSLTRDERIGAKEYLNWISNAYDELFSSAPLIPDEIYKQWQDAARQNNLTIPRQPEIAVAVAEPAAQPVPDAVDHIELQKYNDGQMKYQLARLNAH